MKSLTNKEFLDNLAFESEFGIIAEAFIIEAISEYSKTIIEKGVPNEDRNVISGVLWYNVAKEIEDKLKLKFN